MENSTELVRLEQFVDNLLTRYKALQEKNGRLEEKLEKRDVECARLKETIAELRDERSDVGSRISGLIERIEKWEGEQEHAGQAAGGEIEDGMQGSLFNRESPAA